MKKINRIPLHDRNITLKGFIREDSLYDIEAELIDIKHYNIPNKDRGNILKGDPVHQMKVTITVDEEMNIISASALTLNSPFNICKYANNNFKKIVGLKIKSGWRNAALKLIGGINGCTHISELLAPIATTAFQTIQGSKSEKTRKSKISKISNNQKPALLGSCHAFNPKSEVVKRLWPKWYQN